MPAILSEQDLILKCCQGDRMSQKQIYQNYAGKMMVVALRYLKSTQSAEDVLQDAFIKVFTKLDTFKGDSKLETWISRIVINTALNAIKKPLWVEQLAEYSEGFVQQDELVLSNFHWQDLISYIQALPAGCQAVFNLYAIEGYTHKEIAKMLGISESTSKSQYARAKSLLRRIIVKEENSGYESA
jgi:RNA polymerase sigma factor (sigma-70 family)